MLNWPGLVITSDEPASVLQMILTNPRLSSGMAMCPAAIIAMDLMWNDAGFHQPDSTVRVVGHGYSTRGNLREFFTYP